MAAGGVGLCRGAYHCGCLFLWRAGLDDAWRRRNVPLLREAYSPLWGFLYGWTIFTVIQTGTIAAVAVAFSRFLGVLAPSISESQYLIPPITSSAHYAITYLRPSWLPSW